VEDGWKIGKPPVQTVTLGLRKKRGKRGVRHQVGAALPVSASYIDCDATEGGGGRGGRELAGDIAIPRAAPGEGEEGLS